MTSSGLLFADCYRQTAGPHNTIADKLSPCLCITVAAISFLLEASFTERDPSSIKTARGTCKLQAFPEYHIPTQLDRTAGITENTALHRVPISGQLTSALAAARQQRRLVAPPNRIHAQQTSESGDAVSPQAVSRRRRTFRPRRRQPRSTAHWYRGGATATPIDGPTR